MTEIIISLSTEAIRKEILAESALRHFVRPEQPAPLTHDRDAALRELITATFATLCMELGPMLTASSADTDGEILTLTLEAEPASAPQLRKAVEHLIATRVMARIYASTDATHADTLTDRAATTLRTLATQTSRLTSPTLPTITPNLY